MKALADKADFSVNWRPFQLNPSAEGGEGVNKMEMYTKKFGADRVKGLLPQMIATGQQDGINFSYGGNVGNTFDSHRLIAFAEKQGKQDAIVEELFRNYFEEEKCLSDQKVLLAAANKVGLTGAEELLAGSMESAEVNADLDRYQGSMGISGVPHFLFNGKHGESGALPSSDLKKIIEQCIRESKA
mmetsp:Transcript_51558/g.83641  ORF Transcript_51558/g.83641 Transcript_51558/m.83641 type:complete len:186 (-) Transcript_51558:285-842(-)|eukprot:CAMPEP_0115086694 /NCGR_PEP_ID=MMETSP0227-20121206/22753_1 /TAXON_ID=89957 /ORGANISM="Polarella glacialis, Strain CCMP 1383" /LENGTH=185 /DNA_ID=CAMNT_0002476231 /DNA_START=172 /DNA_END=729 /DNA_ORIENTATION=-